MLDIEIKQESNLPHSLMSYPKMMKGKIISVFAFKTKTGEQFIEPFNKQDSSMMATLAKANCLIVREPFDKREKG